ncbi:MAG: DUF4286 family protein [Bacteroidota bacterium]|jgi:hypothetical protein|nr:MAG: DUF4286 domain-containing protein [Bacteroidota bacterium]
MYLYNVTIGIDKASEREWLDYMRTTYIPDVMATGLFTQARMYRVLHDNEDDTTSYSVQYIATSIDNVQKFLEEYGPSIINAHRDRFRDKHVAFMTLLEEI